MVLLKNSFFRKYIRIFYNSFCSQGKGGSALRPIFFLLYLAGCRDSNPSCCCDRSQVCYQWASHIPDELHTYLWATHIPISYTHPCELHTSLWATHIPMSYTHPFFCTMSGFESATVCATIKLLPYLNVSVRGSRSSFRFYVGSESVQNENRSDTLLNAVLWIRIRIRSVFKGFLEPDP